MVKVNSKLLPVKLHYFFFMAGMGPIIPFYPLIGKQLGLSEAALGSITAVFPLLYLVIKPLIGLFADYFYSFRKLLFVGFVLATCICFNLLATIHDSVSTIYWKDIKMLCNHGNMGLSEICLVKCGGDFISNISKLDDGKLYVGSFYGEWNVSEDCCSGGKSDEHLNDCYLVSTVDNGGDGLDGIRTCLLNCPSQFNLTYNFWIFTILTSLGCIFYNITNFFSDAICFDVLGEGNSTKYGYQRVWGAVGFGLSALISGYAVDAASNRLPYYNFIPAFILASACISLDVYFSSKLKLPELSKPENIVKDVWSLIKQPRVAFFLIFATFVGVMDSSIFYFLLWYLEDLAVKSGSTSDIKLLQGLTVALETLGGETVSFFLSGWVIEKIGFGQSMSVGFLFYSLRLGLLAVITDPWMALPIEGLLQGPSYALLYSTIVAYASSVTPQGTSATVQGLVAGMDDGLGIAVGSLMGGFIYMYYGGSILYTSYAIAAFLFAVLHFMIFMLCFNRRPQNIAQESFKMYHLAKTDNEDAAEKNANNNVCHSSI